MEKYFVVVAGGKGLRMGGEVPKQYLELMGLPILMHTLNNLYQAESTSKIILVLPDGHADYWAKLCTAHNFNLSIQLAVGGNSRFNSVAAGLAYVPNGALVAIHDAVRPFVNSLMVNQLFASAQQKGAAIPVVPVTDSVRRRTPNGSEPIDRTTLVAVQTPQVFQSDLIKQAFAQALYYNKTDFTDDATVAEASGIAIDLVDGNPNNFKITTPVDILRAQALLSENFE